MNSQFEENKVTFSPLTQPVSVRDVAAFDIEGTGDIDGFENAAVLVGNELNLYNNPRNLIKQLTRRKYRGHYFYAHNLQYDLGILLPYMNVEHSAMFINGSAFLVKLRPSKETTVYLVDSLRIAGYIGLERLGKKFGHYKLPTPNALLPNETNNLEWTCVAHHRMGCYECYVKQDVRIVKAYVDLFQREINGLGGELKNTLASTAMDLFRRRFLSQELFTPFQYRNDYARDAYYGGRVEVFRQGKVQNVNVYDINSLYPYIMRNAKLPHPNYLVGPVYEPSANLIYDYEGVSDVTIEIPQCSVPVLPFRHERRLYFPVGTLRAKYTHCELRRAVRLGAKLIHCHSTLFSTERITPFRAYVDCLYARRLELKRANDPREHIYKLLLNSLYGKFGQRMDTGLAKLVSVDDYFDAEDKSGHDFIEIDSEMWITEGVQSKWQPPYINVLFAAYITALARLELFKYLYEFQDTLVYCDTDSVFIQDTIPTSTTLGAMKLEFENVDVEIYAPKAYILYKNGEQLKIKCKGIPEAQRYAFLRGGEARYLKAMGIFESFKRNTLPDGRQPRPSIWFEMHKTFGELVPKRDYTNPFRSFPLPVSQLP